MASNNNQMNTDKITEGLYGTDLWNPFDFHFVSYVKSPMQYRFINSKTSVIGRALRHAVVDLLDKIIRTTNNYIEDETTVIGTEHRLYHSRRYSFKLKDDDIQCADLNDTDTTEIEITSLAPTVFYQLREDIGISNDDFRRSFDQHHLKDFTNPGKSGALMYKTSDDLFILKTLRSYEARLLMQILSGYHLQLTQRSTLFNRYVGLYSIRFPTMMSSIEVYIVIMSNAFTPSLQINEIFDLKGSTMKRKLTEKLANDKLHKLKDMDFVDLYPSGIRIPSNIYHRLHMVISNDVKVLKKLHIIDFSLIIGIRHLDMSEKELVQCRPTIGIAALLHMSHNIALLHLNKPNLSILPSEQQTDFASLPRSYLKPLKMLNEKIDTDLFYNNDFVAHATLPIPGIVNKSNQRVYIYLAIVDMLQTYDSCKQIEQTLKKITDPSRHLQYSVVGPDEYEKRIIKFLFDSVFIDGGDDDFPWAITEVSKPVSNINKESTKTKKTGIRRRSHSTEPNNVSSPSTIHFRL